MFGSKLPVLFEENTKSAWNLIPCSFKNMCKKGGKVVYEWLWQRCDHRNTKFTETLLKMKPQKHSSALDARKNTWCLSNSVDVPGIYVFQRFILAISVSTKNKSRALISGVNVRIIACTLSHRQIPSYLGKANICFARFVTDKTYQRDSLWEKKKFQTSQKIILSLS